MPNTAAPSPQEESYIDFRELAGRLVKGLPLTVALMLLVGAVPFLFAWAQASRGPTETKMTVTLTFPGIERGEYPDRTKFNQDDLRSPLLVDIAAAKIQVTSGNVKDLLINGLGVQGIVPPGIAKERERLRSIGQTPPPYAPSDYDVSLVLPRDAQIPKQLQALFLNELVEAYKRRFATVYGAPPQPFGAIFKTLKGSDFYAYKIGLSEEIRELQQYLGNLQLLAGSYRAPSTGYTFGDLDGQVQLFADLNVNNAFAQLSQAVGSHTPDSARRLQYYVKTLEANETRLDYDSKVVTDLMAKTDTHGASYINTSKVSADLNRPVVSDSVLDTLITSDAYNFLVHKALLAGQDLQNAKARKEEAIELLKQYNESGSETVSAADAANVLKQLEGEYVHLLDLIRSTVSDYANQKYADAISIANDPQTSSTLHGPIIVGVTGAAAGMAIGLGLSLIGIGLTGRQRA